jgi:DNA-binding NarL/FixJ family response regulator
MSSRSVLIVDASAENREVLRTVLGRRGLTVLEAEEADQGLELARQHHPDVIVLDVEEKQLEHSPAGRRFASEADACGSRLIVLGKIRRGPVFTGGHVISKPYHFAPLIHTIEQLAAKAA